MASRGQAPQTPHFMTNTSASTARIVDLRSSQSRASSPSPLAAKQSKTKNMLTGAKNRFNFRSSASRRKNEPLRNVMAFKDIPAGSDHPRSQRNVLTPINLPIPAVPVALSSGPILATSISANKPLPSLPIARVKGESPQHRRSLIDATEKPLTRLVSPSPGVVTSQDWDTLQPTRSSSFSTVGSEKLKKEEEEGQATHAQPVTTTWNLVENAENNSTEQTPDNDIASSKRAKPYPTRVSADVMQLDSSVGQKTTGSTATEVLRAEAAGRPSATINVRKTPRLDSDKHYGPRRPSSSPTRIPSLEKSFSNLRLSAGVHNTKTAAVSKRESIQRKLSPAEQFNMTSVNSTPNPFYQKTPARNSSDSKTTSIPRPVKSLSPRRYSSTKRVFSPKRTSSPSKYVESGRLTPCTPIMSRVLKVKKPQDCPGKEGQASFSRAGSSPSAKSSQSTTALDLSTVSLAAQGSGPSRSLLRTSSVQKTGSAEDTMVARESVGRVQALKPPQLRKVPSLENQEAEKGASPVNEQKQVLDQAFSANTSQLPTPVITEGGSSTEVLLGVDLQDEVAVVGKQDAGTESVSIRLGSEIESLHTFEELKPGSNNENLSAKMSKLGPVLKIDEDADRIILGDELDTDKEDVKKLKRRTSVSGDLFHRGSEFVKSTLRKSILGLSRSKTRGSLASALTDDNEMPKLDKGKGKVAAEPTKRASMKPTRMINIFTAKGSKYSDVDDLNAYTYSSKYPEDWPLRSGLNPVVDNDEDWIPPLTPRANAKTCKLPTISISSSPPQRPVPNNTPVLADYLIHTPLQADNSSPLRIPHYSKSEVHLNSATSSTTGAAASSHLRPTENTISSLRRDLKTAKNIIKGTGNNFFESFFRKMGNRQTMIPGPATPIQGVRPRRDPAALAQRMLELARTETNIVEQARLLEMGEALVQGIENANTAQEAAEDARQMLLRAERAALLALEAIDRILDELERLFPEV